MSETTPPASELPKWSLILGILGLLCPTFILSLLAVILGKKSLNRIKAGTVDPEQRGLALGGVISGCIGMASLLIYGTVGAAVVFPALAKAKVRSQIMLEHSNLRMIGMSLAVYADTNDGFLPPDLATLAEQGYLPPGTAWVSPGKGKLPPTSAKQILDGSKCDYRYFLPNKHLKSIENPAKTVMVAGDVYNFSSTIVVCFADVHTDQDDTTNILDLAAQARGWLIPAD